MQSPNSLSSAGKYIFDQRPFLVYWEITRSCDLACLHCRAEAHMQRNPFELNQDEAFRLLDQIKDFGAPYPHLVVTGGDPLNHPDLYKILKRGQELGIDISLSPSGTTNLTQEAFHKFKKLGIQTVSLSLDGATSQSHDAFRGVPGCFDQTIKAAEFARNAGIPIQINSLVSENTIADLIPLFELVKTLDIVRWSVFFLISVGRGTALKELSAESAEEVMDWLAKAARRVSFSIKTTEAPHFRRVVVQKMKAMSRGNLKMSELPFSRGFGIRDANGIMFISHKGDVYPSGFLPLVAGNVRKQSPVEIYRNSDVFTQVRHPKNLTGKCAECEFRYICGGSRARAFAATGSATGSDPLCSYQPSGFSEKKVRAQKLQVN